MKTPIQWVADYRADKRSPDRQLQFSTGALVQAIQEDAVAELHAQRRELLESLKSLVKSVETDILCPCPNEQELIERIENKIANP